MKITVTREAFRTILEHSRAQFPLEACGLVAGLDKGDLREVTLAVPLQNAERSRHRFAIDPREQLEAVKGVRELGLSPLGNYHSHPETPARPSEEDLKLFLDPKASHLIISLASRRPVLKSFGLRTEDGRRSSAEEELEIVAGA
jgi:proteasome lid subunit RPN8/RPN11